MATPVGRAEKAAQAEPGVLVLPVSKFKAEPSVSSATAARAEAGVPAAAAAAGVVVAAP
jgi:hypothetical protein